MKTANEIASEVRAGAASPETYVKEALARIDAVDARIQAWVEVDRGAKAASSGPLAGVPVGIKDIIDVCGLPTRYGSAPFTHQTPSVDAGCVARLRAAGAAVLGKTHTTHFAYLDPAPTHNPWDLSRTPGGSSSGSAAAVASGMVPLALGTQTVGSVLRPAAYCGVVGLKPTFGRITTTGVVNLAHSFDHVGVICRSVADAALGLSVLAGYDPADPYSVEEPVDGYVAAVHAELTRAPRLGLLRTYYAADCGDEVAKHLEEMALLFKAAGADVDEVDVGFSAAELSAASLPIMRTEAALAHKYRFPGHENDFGPNLRALIEGGHATPAANYQASLRYIAQARETLADSLRDDFDAFLLPTAPATAPDIATTGNGIFCGLASFTSLPSISLPSGIGAGGLPLAVQLIGPAWQEASLLAIARWVEKLLAFEATPAL